MHGGNPTYEYYNRWSFTAPVVLLALILIFTSLSFLLVWPIKHLLKNYHKNTLVSAVRDVVMRMNTFFLIEFEEKLEQKTEAINQQVDGGEKGLNDDTHLQTITVCTYSMYGVVVHTFLVYYLFRVFFVMVLVSAVTFFITFAIEVSLSCEENFDCYLRNGSTIINERINTAITGCGDYVYDELICFRYGYKYSEGLGEAGGFLFVSQVLVNFLTYVSVRLSSKGNCNKCITIALCAAMTIAFIFIVIVLPLALSLESKKFRETLKTPQRQLQVFIYCYSNFILAFIPIVAGCGSYGTESKNKSTAINIQSSTGVGINEQPAYNITPNPLFSDDDEEQTDGKDFDMTLY